MPQLNLNFSDIPIPETCLWEQFDDVQKQTVIETLARLLAKASRAEQTQEQTARARALNGRRRCSKVHTHTSRRTSCVAQKASVASPLASMLYISEPVIRDGYAVNSSLTDTKPLLQSPGSTILDFITSAFAV
jgi:hypothetical protein